MVTAISFVAIGGDQSWSYFVWNLLGGDNVHLECCLDIEDGLRCVVKNSAQVVSLDLGMDSLNGPQMLNRIFGESPATRAVILTGRSAGNAAIIAIRRGTADYITKSVYLQDLRWQLWPLLRNSRTMGID